MSDRQREKQSLAQVVYFGSYVENRTNSIQNEVEIRAKFGAFKVLIAHNE